MILLGSIERAQLQSLLAQQLGRPRRLEYIRERSVAEKKRLSVVSDPGSDIDSQRISQEVRFQVRGLRRRSIGMQTLTGQMEHLLGRWMVNGFVAWRLKQERLRPNVFNRSKLLSLSKAQNVKYLVQQQTN